ncbi:MAG: hypothetical protein RIT45_191 [Pseudomonadota bacterium]|jgi:hypothetical protein
MSAAAAEVVYRWDLDKTYLQTDFHSVGGLVRAAVERPEHKRPVPGMRALMTALSRRRAARIVFVSGSPTQLRGRIEAMFELHGVRCDRLVLKDFAGAIRRGRLRSIKAQIPYKLRAHLETRRWLREQGDVAAEICFGDDAEVDALIYCLYADVVARRVDASRLRALLDHVGAYPDERDAILAALAALPREEVVRRVFIHLDSRSPPSRYDGYGGRVVPTFNAFQIVASLYSDGLCGPTEVRVVADDLITAWRVDGPGIAGSLEDAVRRGIVSSEAAERLAREVLPMGLAGRAGFDAAAAERLLRRVGSMRPPSVAADVALPYERLVEDERAFAAARKMARQAAGRVPGLRDFLEPDAP